ncbi:hypothetical protein RND71_042482 [Anisodus tanguticus]|uniref:peroxidase n=1 Tax=Anisodus tanguticus TaxID=243964 RepID=A0AAE1QR15_9SOLA|nr:hypothetical protein RND71_042482 [Anisodus tanguticus]
MTETHTYSDASKTKSKDLLEKVATSNSLKGVSSIVLEVQAKISAPPPHSWLMTLKKGILKIDQQLALERSSAGIVANFSVNPKAFQQAFANALIKLGNTEVLEGRLGEIRKNCRAFNPPQQKQRQPITPRKNFPHKKPKNPPPRKGPKFTIPFLAS